MGFISTVTELMINSIACERLDVYSSHYCHLYTFKHTVDEVIQENVLEDVTLSIESFIFIKPSIYVVDDYIFVLIPIK
jgi:hypothetical protein